MLHTTYAASPNSATQAVRVSMPVRASKICASASRPTIQISRVSPPSTALTAYSTSATCVISFAFGTAGAMCVASSTASSGSTTASSPMKAKKALPARPVTVL